VTLPPCEDGGNGEGEREKDGGCDGLPFREVEMGPGEGPAGKTERQTWFRVTVVLLVDEGFDSTGPSCALQMSKRLGNIMDSKTRYFHLLRLLRVLFTGT
jgi:hypothetical protein